MKKSKWQPGRLPRSIPIIGERGSDERKRGLELLRIELAKSKASDAEKQELEREYLALP